MSTWCSPFQKRAVALALAFCLATGSGLAPLAAAPERSRPYDEQLLRLAEILGAIHYLRAVCGAKDGQKWRLAMEKLIEAEGTSAFRRAVLARHFNRGYRGYSRTYRNCTPTAETTIARFFVEAVDITDALAKFAR